MFAGEVFLFMNLEGTWPVHLNGSPVGQCQFRRRGLYWDMTCACVKTDGQVLRLMLMGEAPHSLGIPAPEAG